LLQRHAPPSSDNTDRPRVLAAMDIGTNSIRLEVARVEPDHGLTTLTQQKETVRLGERGITSRHMSAAAIERGVLVITRFAEVARGFGATEIVALATSAVREAENQEEFLDRVRDEADLEVRVISGREEARLIHLGVAGGADLSGRRALFIDIGGGSTELIIGDNHQDFTLDSLKLGSIRMAEKFLRNETGQISDGQFDKMKAYVRGVASHTSRRMVTLGFDTVIGSAGTITNLASVTAKRLGDSLTSLRNYEIPVSAIQDTVTMLRRLPLADRRRVPGLDAERADIILGGAAVLMTLLEDVGAQKLTISDRGLRHGILLDTLMREAGAKATYEQTPIRLRSILQLCRACGFDEEHAWHVQRLSFALFDELRRLNYLRMDYWERELLGYAALAHDIGCFLSHSGHERHAYYLIRHSDLLGFNDTEIAILANVALYHRKSLPRRSHRNMESLPKKDRRVITALAAILRVAEGLDRSHLANIREVSLEVAKRPKRLLLTMRTDSECQLELWGVEQNRDLFEQFFGFPLDLRVVSPGIHRDGIRNAELGETVMVDSG